MKPKEKKRLLVAQRVAHSVSDVVVTCRIRWKVCSVICTKKRVGLAEKDGTGCQLSVSVVQLVMEGE